MIEPAFSIDLSQDELVWLLVTMHIPPMFGMDDRYFPEGISEEVTLARLHGGVEALRARGLVETEHEKVNIESALMGLFGTYVFAEQAVMVIHGAEGEPSNELFVYYQTPRLVLEHSMTSGGLHHFSVFGELGPLAEEIVSHLGIVATSDSESPAYWIAQDVFQRAIETAKSGAADSALTELLQAPGWDDWMAQVFVQIVSAQQSAATVILLRPEGEGEARHLSADNSFILINAPLGTLWIADAAATEAEPAGSQVAVCSAHQVQEYLQQQLALV